MLISDLALGDVVTFRSGGREMTVNHFDHNRLLVSLIWHDANGVLQSADLVHPQALVKKEST